MGFVGVSPFLVKHKKQAGTGRGKQGQAGASRDKARRDKQGQAGTHRAGQAGASRDKQGQGKAGQGRDKQGQAGQAGSEKNSELHIVLNQELVQGVPTAITVEDESLTVVNLYSWFHKFRFWNEGSSA